MLLTPRELLQATINLYQKEFWLLLGYAAWFLVPFAAYFFASSLPPNPVTTVLVIVTVVLQLFVWLWVCVCLMKATALLAEKKTVDPHTLSTVSLRRVQALLAVIFLQFLIVIGGLLLLVIPSIIFWVWYSLAQVTVTLTDNGPIESLVFSRSLVTGRFSRVLWRLVSGPIVIGLMYAFASGLVLLVLTILFQADYAVVFSANPPLWVSLIQAIIDIFFIPLFIIYSVLLYLDLLSHPVEKARSVA